MRATRLCITIFITLILGIFINFVNLYDVSAEPVSYEVNIEPALNITVTSDGVATNNVTLDLNPLNHTFDSKTIDVKVSTNNVTGYQLSVSTSNNSTALTRNTTNDSNTGSSTNIAESTIETLSNSTSDTTSSSFETNNWGYRIASSTTNPDKVTNYYNPFTLNNNLAVNHYATNGDTTTLDFAAKIDWNQPAGTYENTLVFTATATYAAYDIKYYNGIDNAENQEIAVQTNDYNTSSNVKLEPGVTPTRSTYDFVKWCDTIPGADTNNYFPATVCNGNTYNTGDTITINPEDYNTNIKLYAYWDPTTFEEAYEKIAKQTGDSSITTKVTGKTSTNQDITAYQMQKMSKDICAATTINEVTQLVDNRVDGSVTHVYYVAKLKDDKCWMTQNLRLGTNVSSLELKASDSNVTHNFTILKDADGKFPIFGITDDRYDNNGNKTTYISGSPSVSAYYCSPVSGNNYVGCYYNWYTATAGAYIGNTSNEQVTPGTTGWKDVDSSICPKNWYLPTGGTGRSDSDFQLLSNAYHQSSDEMRVAGTCTKSGDAGCDNTTGKPELGLLLSGYYYSGGAYVVGQRGYYWSRSAWSKGVASVLSIDSSAVSTQNYGGKYLGFSVRCVAYGS